jgi:glycosyltransferase involved in cell wall biosynthesis
MSVIFVAYEYPARSQTFVVAEADAMADLGVDVHLYALHHPGAGARDRPHVVTLRSTLRCSSLRAWFGPLVKLLQNLHRVTRLALLPPKTLKRRLRSVKALLHALALAAYVDSRPDEVHIRAHFFGLMSEVALLASWLTSAPVTVSIAGHAADVARPPSPARLKFEVGSVDLVTCASKFVLRSLHEQCGRVGHADIVRCGVRDRAKVEVLQDVNAVRLLTVARLVDKKGIDDCVRACEILTRRDGRKIHWTVVGDGPEFDRLRRLVVSLGLMAEFALVGERRNAEVIEELSERCDVFVLPARVSGSGDVDGIPVALMEAMSMAIPVVTTNVGGIPELVRDRDTGFVVPERSPAAIATVIESLIDSPAEARHVAEGGRSHVLEEFGLHRQAEILRDLISDVRRDRRLTA